MLIEDQDAHDPVEPAAVAAEVRPGRLGIVLVAILALTMFGAATTLGVLYMNEKKARAEQVAELSKNAKDDAAKLSTEKNKLQVEVSQLRACIDSANAYAKAALAEGVPMVNIQWHC